MKFKELTKEDLNSLRIMAHYPIKSNLKKADLVSALEDAFRKDPMSLLQAGSVATESASQIPESHVPCPPNFTNRLNTHTATSHPLPAS